MEPAGLALPKPCIGAAGRQQLRVAALLDDPALVEHDQAIEARDGGEPMRDRDHRATLHQPVELLLDRRLDL